jgi:hypothetical protein
MGLRQNARIAHITKGGIRMKTIIQIAELDDYVEMLRKAKPDNVFFVVEVGQQEIKQEDKPARQLFAVCKLTAAKDEVLLGYVGPVGNLVITKDEDMKEFGELVKQQTEAVIKRLQRDCPGSRLWKGTIALA